MTGQAHSSTTNDESTVKEIKFELISSNLSAYGYSNLSELMEINTLGTRCKRRKRDDIRP